MRFGNISFNHDYVKSLSFDEFKKEFTGKFVCKTHTIEQIYSEVTGFSSEKPKDKPFDPREKIKIDGPDETKKKRKPEKDSKKETPVIETATESSENSEETPSE
jgi:hypothetical protein